MYDEKWKDVKGYEGIYKISNRGRVMSFITRWPSKLHRILKHNKNNHGYHKVDLYKAKKRHPFLVHRLVLAAFIEPSPKDKETNHKDGDKNNNNVNNLEWVTSSENNFHAYKIGLQKPRNLRAEANPNVKLSWPQVIVIRSLKGINSQRKLAKRYGVCKSTIGWIHQGKHW